MGTAHAAADAPPWNCGWRKSQHKVYSKRFESLVEDPFRRRESGRVQVNARQTTPSTPLGRGRITMPHRLRFSLRLPRRHLTNLWDEFDPLLVPNLVDVAWIIPSAESDFESTSGTIANNALLQPRLMLQVRPGPKCLSTVTSLCVM